VCIKPKCKKQCGNSCDKAVDLLYGVDKEVAIIKGDVKEIKTEQKT
jgi:hypothetical protein